MRHLKSFNESNEFLTDPKEIFETLMGIAPEGESTENERLKERIHIHPDGTVDVHDIGNFSGIKIYLGPSEKKLPIKFGFVDGYFSLGACRDLTTLEGSPYQCRNFWMNGLSKIKNLKGGPKIINGDYRAYGSGITSLEGSPEEVRGTFDVDGTKIKSLKGSPKSCYRFLCQENKIKDLIGGPEIVEHLGVRGCPLTSLEGAPKQADILEFDVNIFDPRGLKGCKINRIDTCGRQSFGELIQIFNPYIDKYTYLDRSERSEVSERFINSLDYNYIRKYGDEIKINLFRFKEALHEYDIDLVEVLASPIMQDFRSSPTELRNYKFVDDSGRDVDIYGNPI